MCIRDSTIASRPTEEGLVPGLDGGGMAARLYGLADNYSLTVRDLLSMDSSNIQPEEWQVIARAVYESRVDFDGIVITHGTDTMAYTASVLSFMLRGIEIPVVLTGSQLPIEHPLICSCPCTTGVWSSRPSAPVVSTSSAGT